MATINGTNGSNTLNGTAFADVINGKGGNDRISGKEGNDVIDGGAGNDILSGDDGIDTVSYVSAAAAVRVNLANVRAQNTLGAGTDTLSGFENLTGSRFNDTLTGNTLANVIYGYAGNDIISGGLGDDVLDGGAGNDILRGDAGIDTVNYTSAGAAVRVILTSTRAQNTLGAGTDTLSGFENITGSRFNDTLTGSAVANTIMGAAGNDTISGGAGDDIIEGGLGNDNLRGDAGIDTISYGTATAGVTFNLNLAVQNTIGAGVDRTSGFENIRGSNFNDTLTGNAMANVINGGLGNDVINGAAGDDLIDGGGGDDVLVGGLDNDTLNYASALGAITLDLTVVTAQNTGGSGVDTVSEFENIIGSAFNDVLIGELNANLINGGDGDDIIDGGTGDDTLIGGAGVDTIKYALTGNGVIFNLATTTAQNTGAGIDTVNGFENIIGSAFDDTLTGDVNNNVIDGGLGNDLLNGDLGIDTISYASATSNVIFNLAITTAQNTGGAGIDTVSNFENIVGSNSNDTLSGDAFDNVIQGGVGDDIISGGAGDDTLIGGSDVDIVDFTSSLNAITLDLAVTSAQNTGDGNDIISGFESILGSAQGDTLIGDANSNSIDGGNGDDIIEGREGDDFLSGGAGTDTVSFNSASNDITFNLAILIAQNTGVGNDVVSGFENITGSAFNDNLTGDANANIINGGAGNDIIEGGSGNDILIGGADIDTLKYSSAVGAIYLLLHDTSLQDTNGAGFDIVIGFENIIGSDFSDSFEGTGGANIIHGGGSLDLIHGLEGEDILFGDAGDDLIYGDEDNDILDGGLGNDTLNGGAGSDTASYATATDRVFVNLSIAGAQDTNGAGTDTLTSIENLTGSDFNDYLQGNSGANVLNGGAGDDTIYGGDGNDSLYGGIGNDTVTYLSSASGVTVNLSLVGAQNTIGAGIDTLSGIENIIGSTHVDIITGDDNDNVIRGSNGADILTGGLGADTFDYNFITDRGNGTEIITDFVVGTDILDLRDVIDDYTSSIGFNAFSGGFLRFDFGLGVAAGTAIRIDADGYGSNSSPVLLVTLVDAYLTQDDFASYIITPVVLDLDNSGDYDFLTLNSSQAYFDVNGDNQAEHLAWVGSKDGVLIFDANQDGKVNDSTEFAFSQYLEGAKTDLEGLQAFDSNHDGQLNNQDERFDQFAVWQDKNENGQTDEGEMFGLEQLGIAAINLVSDHQMQHLPDTIIYGQGTFSYNNGQMALLADVGFHVEDILVNENYLL